LLIRAGIQRPSSIQGGAGHKKGRPGESCHGRSEAQEYPNQDGPEWSGVSCQVVVLELRGRSCHTDRRKGPQQLRPQLRVWPISAAIL